MGVDDGREALSGGGEGCQSLSRAPAAEYTGKIGLFAATGIVSGDIHDQGRVVLGFHFQLDVRTFILGGAHRLAAKISPGCVINES